MYKIVDLGDNNYKVPLGVYTKEAADAMDFMLSHTNDHPSNMFLMNSHVIENEGSVCHFETNGEVFLRLKLFASWTSSPIEELVERRLLFARDAMKKKAGMMCMDACEKTCYRNGKLLLHELLSDESGFRSCRWLVGEPFDPFITAKLDVLWNEYGNLFGDDHGVSILRAENIEKQIKETYEKEWERSSKINIFK